MSPSRRKLSVGSRPDCSVPALIPASLPGRQKATRTVHPIAAFAHWRPTTLVSSSAVMRRSLRHSIRCAACGMERSHVCSSSLALPVQANRRSCVQASFPGSRAMTRAFCHCRSSGRSVPRSPARRDYLGRSNTRLKQPGSQCCVLNCEWQSKGRRHAQAAPASTCRQGNADRGAQRC